MLKDSVVPRETTQFQLAWRTVMTAAVIEAADPRPDWGKYCNLKNLARLVNLFPPNNLLNSWRQLEWFGYSIGSQLTLVSTGTPLCTFCRWRSVYSWKSQNNRNMPWKGWGLIVNTHGLIAGHPSAVTLTIHNIIPKFLLRSHLPHGVQSTNPSTERRNVGRSMGHYIQACMGRFIGIICVFYYINFLDGSSITHKRQTRLASSNIYSLCQMRPDATSCHRFSYILPCPSAWARFQAFGTWRPDVMSSQHVRVSFFQVLFDINYAGSLVGTLRTLWWFIIVVYSWYPH